MLAYFLHIPTVVNEGYSIEKGGVILVRVRKLNFFVVGGRTQKSVEEICKKLHMG